MSVSELFKRPNGDCLMWYCPGCRCHHSVPVEGPNAWEWNGSLDSPTLTPSVRHRWDFTDEGRAEKVCHYFVREGRLEYCLDCTHELAGTTVRLEPIESKEVAG